MEDILTYLNSILIILIFLILILKPFISRLSISIDKTFWEKKPYAIRLMLWVYPRYNCPNSGKTIISFKWRNPDKIIDDMKKAK